MYVSKLLTYFSFNFSLSLILRRKYSFLFYFLTSDRKPRKPGYIKFFNGNFSRLIVALPTAILKKKQIKIEESRGEIFIFAML